MKSHLRLICVLLFVFALLTALAVLTLAANNDSYETQVAEWDISAFDNDDVSAKLYKNINEKYTLIIEGEGRMLSWSESDPAPWNSYVAEISEIVIGDDVTNVGNYPP